jgi:glycogen operon protein
VEGPTADADVNRLRARQQRNFLATLLLSQGVPMLLAGDEFGQTQQGNNNAYCQDSPIAWLGWEHTAEQRELLEFTRKILDLRKCQPVFRRRHFFQGRAIHGAEIKDLYWLKADGMEMNDTDWHACGVPALAMVLPGEQISERGERGERITGDSFAILLNAGHEPVLFKLGVRRRDLRWHCVVDTAGGGAGHCAYGHMSEFPLQARSLVVLQAEAGGVPD